MNTFEELIALLKRHRAQELIEKMQAERAAAYDRAVGTNTAKKSAMAAVELYFVTTIRALLEGKPARITRSDLRWDLVQQILEVLKPETVRAISEELASSEPTPTEEPPLELIQNAVRNGQKFRVDFDDGMFAVRLGEVIVEGKTLEEALAKLARIRKRGSSEASSGQEIEKTLTPLTNAGVYSYRRKPSPT